jgi:hypothetical protein
MFALISPLRQLSPSLEPPSGTIDSVVHTAEMPSSWVHLHGAGQVRPLPQMAMEILVSPLRSTAARRLHLDKPLSAR